tara:strand:- start:893 stop:2053 length:1161 start_codon:yes stop_codon:yes gene_type:complete
MRELSGKKFYGIPLGEGEEATVENTKKACGDAGLDWTTAGYSVRGPPRDRSIHPGTLFPPTGCFGPGGGWVETISSKFCRQAPNEGESLAEQLQRLGEWEIREGRLRPPEGWAEPGSGYLDIGSPGTGFGYDCTESWDPKCENLAVILNDGECLRLTGEVWVNFAVLNAADEEVVIEEENLTEAFNAESVSVAGSETLEAVRNVVSTPHLLAATLALDTDIATIGVGTPEREAFETTFRTDMATALGGIGVDRVEILSIKSIYGSLTSHIDEASCTAAGHDWNTDAITNPSNRGLGSQRPMKALCVERDGICPAYEKCRPGGDVQNVITRDCFNEINKLVDRLDHEFNWPDVCKEGGVCQPNGEHTNPVSSCNGCSNALNELLNEC